MKKIVWNNILAVSLSAAFYSTSANAADVALKLPNNEKPIQRNFVNLGFEDPILDFSKRKSGDWGCRLSDGSWTKSYCIFDQTAIAGWRTTAKYEGSLREIELWKSGQLNSNDQNWGPPAAEKSVYAELNSTTSAALYQNVCVSDQDVLNWSFQHRPREKVTEQAGFFIANAVDDSSTKERITLNFNNIPESIRYLKKTDILSRNPGKIHEDVLNVSWTKYSGSNVKLSDYLGGRKSAVMAFGFEALQADGGARGNWLDDVVLKLNPAIEFSAKNGSVVENQTGKYHSVDFNIVGAVEKDMVVKFIIDPNKVKNPALYRQNNEGHFKIFVLNADGTLNKEIIPTASTRADGKAILRFEYTIKYNPSLRYDTGVTIKGLAIQTYDNNVVDGNRVIPFELDPDQTGLAVMDLRNCGTNTFSGFEYEIQDDETDIAVTKTLKNDFLIPNQDVSYEILIENIFNIKDMSSTARNVRLKDRLLANLIRDNKTELTCEVIENDKVKANCPSIASVTQAARDVFSEEGLLIGDLPAKGKLKFTVSKLKISDKDIGVGEYQNFVANQATVTTSSNDIFLDNNTAITKDLFPAKNDLMNADSTNTGKGLFVIDLNGEALWEKPIRKQKAYFPLIIQNDSSMSQEYKLTASSTPIARLLNSDFSGLNPSTMTAFLEGLNIKFYAVAEGMCQSGLSAADISQIQVAATSSTSICAEITASASAAATTDIWFAIESVQTGLGDIIKNKVTYVAEVLRQLELVNDQQAQINVGGTFVFAHRLTNNGSIEETNLQFLLMPLSPQDDFSYTLFIDHNNNGVLDTGDEQVRATTVIPHLAIGESLSLLLKAQAPATAANGMRSQVQIMIKPTHMLSGIALDALTNTDTVVVGVDQLILKKMQFKQAGCVAMTAQEIKNAEYSLGKMSIGRHDCIIYRIEATNIGSEKLNNILINDMYPHYSTPWRSNDVLPMTDSGDAVTKQNDKVATKITQLLPGEKKSLYFGIRLP